MPVLRWLCLLLADWVCARLVALPQVLVLSLLVVAMRQNYEKCANGSERLGGGKFFVNFFTNFPETAAIELV